MFPPPFRSVRQSLGVEDVAKIKEKFERILIAGMILTLHREFYLSLESCKKHSISHEQNL